MWFVASALASELLAWVPTGLVHPGEHVTLAVRCEDCGSVDLAPSQLSVSGAVVVECREAVDGGLRVEAIVGAGENVDLVLSTPTGAKQTRLKVVPRPAPPVSLTVSPEVSLADGIVTVLLSGGGPLQAHDIAVSSSEGVVGPLRAGPDGLLATVTLSADRTARPLLFGALDLRHPGAQPVVAAVRLRARHAGTLSAERGSRVALRIGPRSYGPFIAGEDGTASLSFDSLPGESTYELSVADDLGNTQRLTQTVPTSTRPALILIDGRAELGRELWIAAADARGGVWTGEAPRCRSGVGSPELVPEIAKGRWRWVASNVGPGGDVAVGCQLGETTVTTRLSPTFRRPAAISLRVYPEVLSADFPLAEVQASLIDDGGSRLVPDGLTLTAEQGSLRSTLASDVIRSEYDGSAAARAGADEVRAEWRLQPGQGPVARLELCAGTEDGGITAVARLLDRGGRPVVGASASAEVGGTLLSDTTSDARGFARWRLPASASAQVVTARAAGARAQALAFAESEGSTCIAEASPARADLEARVRIPIRIGRVRQVQLAMDPPNLTLGPGANAAVRVRMLDAAGATVSDEAVSLVASEGIVSTPTLAADGSFTALFSPGPGTDARQILLTATTSAGSATTTLSVTPRPVRGSVAAGFGWLENLETISSPFASLSVEHGLRFAGLSTRFGVGVYGVDKTVESATGNVRVTGSFFPIDFGVTLSNRGPRFNLSAGVSLVLVPYTLAADFGGTDHFDGAGLGPPGVEARGAAGWRLGQTELFTEVGYLLFTAPAGAITLAQNAGGLHMIVGYRLLY